jgi:hypothetical protein
VVVLLDDLVSSSSRLRLLLALVFISSCNPSAQSTPVSLFSSVPSVPSSLRDSQNRLSRLRQQTDPSASSFPPQPQHNAYRRYRGGIVSMVLVTDSLAFTCENTVFCRNIWAGCIFCSVCIHSFIHFSCEAKVTASHSRMNLSPG